MKSTEFITEIITEGINPDILNKGFSHSQEINGYTYTAKTVPHIFNGKEKAPFFVISCYNDDEEIGSATSDAMQHILRKLGATPVTNEQFLRALFKDNALKMINHDTYQRQLAGGTVITETVFGHPKLNAGLDKYTKG